MKNILIAGGAGYIGSMLTRKLLDSRYRVTVLDSLSNNAGESLLGVLQEPNFNFIRGDIRDRRTIRAILEDVDVVINLAAIVGQPACNRNPEESYEINQAGAIDLFKNAIGKGVSRFIFASTCSNYGMLEGEIATEESQVEPTSLYASTKIAVERYLLEAKRSSSTKATILRFATVFGLSSRMRMDLLIHEFVRDAICRHQILVYGPEFWRPFIHVGDVARAIIACIESPVEKVSCEIFNVGGEQNNIRKIDLAHLVARYVPNTKIRAIRTETDLRNYRVSFQKISQTLGYKITKTLDEGIQEVTGAIEKGIINPYDDRWYYYPMGAEAKRSNYT